MPISQDLLQSVMNCPPQDAWTKITEHVWTEFSAPIPSAVADAEVVRRDRDLTELDNVLSGAAWSLWRHFESAVPQASQSLIEFWNAIHGGKAILILDGLSLRETPWILEQAIKRGYKTHRAVARGSELPPETTPFANALGFGQRSALENNLAGSAHRLPGAFTAASDLPWRDCCEIFKQPENIVFWHHWPDDRTHLLAKPGEGLHRLAKETHGMLVSDDFWALVERLAKGRRLIITGDHGYAACGHFPDLVDADQVAYMKKLFKNGRSATTESGDSDHSAWVPPMDLRLTTVHGDYQFVLGRRKWKSPSGYPTLHHGGLSLLEVFVPFIELS